VRGLLLDLTPLRGREYRLLFLGQLISFLGSMITFVALPFQMYELTDSALAVGALGACEFVPIVTVALVSGALADAFDRRKLVLFSELGSAVVMAALVVNAEVNDPQVWVLFVCAAVLAGFYALLRPPLAALVPRVVPREQMKAAMALEWVRGDVGMLAGPAVGGVVIAAFGVTVTFGIDLATFLISLGFLAAMRASPPAPDVHGRAVALAACGWGLAIVCFGFADALWLALACLAVAGGMDAVSGPVPQRDVEPDDPRPPARPPCGRRDDLLHLGPDPRELRGGRGGIVRGRARLDRLGRGHVRRRHGGGARVPAGPVAI
jgi:MFS family permease